MEEIKNLLENAPEAEGADTYVPEELPEPAEPAWEGVSAQDSLNEESFLSENGASEGEQEHSSDLTEEEDQPDYDSGFTVNDADNSETEEPVREEEILASEKAQEAERVAAEKAQEEERLAAERAREEERLAAEKAQEEERLAAERAREEERLAAEKAREEERVAAEKAQEEEHLAAERAQEEARIAAERAQEEARIAAEKEKRAAEKKAKKEAKKEARAARRQAIRDWVPSPQFPNYLTIARICMIPLFVVLILWVPKPLGNILAMIVFILASLTDAADGHIARKYNYITTFGKFMDPLADKLLVCSAMICLVDLGRLESWIVIIIIAREFIISGFRLVAAEKGVVIAANIWGKVKTVVQMLMVILMVGNFGGVFDIAAQILKWAALLLTLISLATYLIQNRHVLQEEGRIQHQQMPQDPMQSGQMQ